MPAVDPPKRPRAAIAWIVLGLAGAAVIASFAIPAADPAVAEKRSGARVAAVSAAPVVKAELTQRGRYPGGLDADAADVAAFYSGRLLAVRVRVGDGVKAGDVLAELDPVDAQEQIARARAQVDSAAAEETRVRGDLEAAAAELARLEPLEGEVVTRSELAAQRARTEALRAEALSAAARGAEARAGVRLLQKRVVESVVRAPFDGRIAARYVDPGAVLPAGARLLRVVATSPLRVRFDVPSQEVEGLAPGTKVRVLTQMATSPSEGATATVRGVAGEVDRARRVAVVEAVIDAPPPGWLPGMFAEAVVERRTLPDAHVVPGAAVLSRMQEGALADGVFLVDGQVARWAPVTVLARDGDRVAVASPDVRPGVQVLVAGHVDLVDGSKIELTKAAAPPPAPPSPASAAPPGQP